MKVFNILNWAIVILNIPLGLFYLFNDNAILGIFFIITSLCFYYLNKLSNKVKNDIKKSYEKFAKKNYQNTFVDESIKQGDTVLLRTKVSDDPLIKAVFDKWHIISDKKFPILKDIGYDNMGFVCSGIVIKYSQDLYDMLENMDSDEQWGKMLGEYNKLLNICFKEKDEGKE